MDRIETPERRFSALDKHGNDRADALAKEGSKLCSRNDAALPASLG